MSSNLFENSELRKNLSLKEILDGHNDEDIAKAAHYILTTIIRNLDSNKLPSRKAISRNPKKCLPILWYRREKLISDNIKNQEKMCFREGVETHELQSKIDFPSCPVFSLSPEQALGFAASQDAMNPPHKGIITTAIKNIQKLKIPNNGGIKDANTFTPLIVWISRGETWELIFQITKKAHTKFLRLHEKSILSALKVEEPNTVKIYGGATQITFRLSFD